MQTFLPYPSFGMSASVLDMRRLGKQRVEAKQIYYALTDPTYGWQNHPAVKMWRGYEEALACYGWTMCAEWLVRGYNDTMLSWFRERFPERSAFPCPPWLGDEAFHRSHQSNLIRKAPFYYQHKWPNVPSNLPYIWPQNASTVGMNQTS